MVSCVVGDGRSNADSGIAVGRVSRWMRRGMFTRVGRMHTEDPWPGWLLGVSGSDNSRRRREYYRYVDCSGMQELAGVVASGGLLSVFVGGKRSR